MGVRRLPDVSPAVGRRSVGSGDMCTGLARLDPRAGVARRAAQLGALRAGVGPRDMFAASRSWVTARAPDSNAPVVMRVGDSPRQRHPHRSAISVFLAYSTAKSTSTRTTPRRRDVRA